MRLSRHSTADTPLQERILLGHCAYLLTVPSGYFTPGAKAAIPQDSHPSISMPRWRYVFRKMTRFHRRKSPPKTTITALTERFRSTLPHAGRMALRALPRTGTDLQPTLLETTHSDRRIHGARVRHGMEQQPVSGLTCRPTATSSTTIRVQIHTWISSLRPPTSPPSTRAGSNGRSSLCKDNFRRYRDLCVILLAAFYLVCMVDAYVARIAGAFRYFPESVDGSLPTMIQPAGGGSRAALGLNWAINFNELS